MARKFIDDDEVISFLSAHPGSTAIEVQQHIGATINGVRTKLRKMVVARVVESKRINGCNHYQLLENTAVFGSPNQALLNALLGRVQPRRMSL
ncbi:MULTISPECIES: hypothetical protein [Citrobacter]|uniref:hypothetical protein n=1 Tax=Citrobacter TaxID=544 RepID=UPI0015EAF257|nr:hypothetical protein [Citrobacter freundii]EKQ7213310.1 hypothetical protein [Citrobacter freundii]QLV95599.1 hypothetical protein HV270_26655 [Citrobacter freundii]HCB1565959.1 hypothetical protein [Citrobacter freundii]HEB2429418.1 hypothetical protein [Citrobacter freundii]